MKNNLVKDLEKMFRFSGMVDQLRDTSRELIEVNPSRETLAAMADQYMGLRDELQATLAGDAAEQITRWAPSIDRETVSADGVLFAAAQLSRWVDLAHQAPKFLVAEEVAGAAAVKMTAEAKATLDTATVTPAEKPAGVYL